MLIDWPHCTTTPSYACAILTMYRLELNVGKGKDNCHIINWLLQHSMLQLVSQVTPFEIEGAGTLYTMISFKEDPWVGIRNGDRKTLETTK